jgi:Putative adhesin
MISGPHAAWLAAGSVLTIASAGWGAFNVVDLLAHEVRTDTEVVDAEGVSLIDIDNSSGRVVVTGTDTDEIRIVARVSDGLRATGNSYRVVDDRLEIRGTCPLLGSMWCSVDYRIEVPADIDLVLDVDDRVEVVDMRGGLTIDSDNGRIEIRGADGPLRATADNGTIDATGIRSATVFAESDNGSVEIVMVEPPQDLRASSDNGSVEVVLPDTPDTYAVDAGTDNGSVRNEVRTDPAGARTITLRSDNGDVTVRYPD